MFTPAAVLGRPTGVLLATEVTLTTTLLATHTVEVRRPEIMNIGAVSRGVEIDKENLAQVLLLTVVGPTCQGHGQKERLRLLLRDLRQAFARQRLEPKLGFMTNTRRQQRERNDP